MYVSETPRTVAIAAHKGGVGKTTTAMALAAALARWNRDVTLIDLDPQAHSSMGLGLELPADADGTVRDLFPIGRQDPQVGLRDVSHQATDLEHLRIVPATIDLELCVAHLYGRGRRERFLKDAIEQTGARDEWFVIDCPPTLSPLVENAIYAADLVIVPCRMEARATDGVVGLLELLFEIRGQAFGDWRILRTVVDSHKKATNVAIDAALSSKYSDRILETVIPVSEPLNKAQIARQDIFAFDPSSTGAGAYGELLEEVIRLCHGTAPVA